MKKVYGLIGEKLGHSFSPQIHKKIFELLGMEAEYKLFELTEDELHTSISEYRSKGIKGLNVTVPYKIRIMDFLNVISAEAEKIGAVNTISFADGVLTGHNTDYHGFGMSLARSQVSVIGKNTVVLGTGGSSKAVVQYLLDNGAAGITYVSRNPEKGSERKEYSLKTVGYGELASLKGDILINCTPCGMYPMTDASPLPDGIPEGFSTAIDLIYNPEETVFMRQAEEGGLKAVNGLYMLVGQAVAAQQIWNGVELSQAQVEDIYKSIRDLLYRADAGKNNA